jgi:hypothetical protein
MGIPSPLTETAIGTGLAVSVGEGAGVGVGLGSTRFRPPWAVQALMVKTRKMLKQAKRRDDEWPFIYQDYTN